MKQLIRIKILLVLSLVLNIDTSAQFEVAAEYRNRFEIRDGYRQILEKSDNAALFMSQRTRLVFVYQNEKLKLKITPQDVRIWGDEQLSSSTGVYGDYASFDLFEGYAELKTGKIGCISVGRQQLVYDNQRLLAARNWNQMGLSYDALLAKIKLNDWNMHLAGTWNTQNENTSENPFPSKFIKTLNFLWINREFGESIYISALHIASGITETDTTNRLRFRQTSGIYAKLTTDRLCTWTNVYYQYGKNSSGTNVSALLFDFDLSFPAKAVTPGLGISYLSGNSVTGTNLKTDHLFDVLYGARHKYFGSMDYFRDFAKNTNQGGLVDFYAYVNIQILKSLSINNSGHYFMLAQTNSATPNNRKLGYEHDLLIKYKANSYTAIEAGYSFIVATQSLKTMQKVTDPKLPQYFYLQLTLTPTFLNTDLLTKK